MDNDQNKQLVADAGAIVPLINLLNSTDTFAQSQSAGALSECSIRNDKNSASPSPLASLDSHCDMGIQGVPLTRRDDDQRLDIALSATLANAP